MNKNEKENELVWGKELWFRNFFDSQDEDDPSSYYGHKYSGYQSNRHEVIAKIVQKNIKVNVSTMLDIGCGAGDLTNLIKNVLNSNECVGIDFVEPVIKKAKIKFPKIDFKHSNLMDSYFENESFNLIIASEVLYYLSEDDRYIWLNKIQNLLKPGGYFIFTSVLGPKYFSVSSARTYNSTNFDIITEKIEYYKIYHFITSFFFNIRLVRMYINNNKYPGSEASKKKLSKIKILLNIPLSHKILNFFCWVSGIVLKSKN